ncbi:hypothetical protein [Streptomyces sp. NPDC096068]|uniref:hypothetical protein n=1 Tax=Streptomyces sp. NPDC096068 TaxID=3155424 RepID=UPI00332FD831
MTDPIHAPWTTEQVQALNEFQQRGGMHPFTCGAEHTSGRSPVLDATHSGWICPDPKCAYTQDWAHAFMAEPREPDNPAAWALARHIADHPISVLQAAFRYLNSPLVLELHDDGAARQAGGQQPDTTTPDPTTADDPIPLRWGFGDVLHGDDDTRIVCLSGPDREPYWLKLDPERAQALRDDLAGPEPAPVARPASGLDATPAQSPALTTGHQPGRRCGRLIPGRTPGTWNDCALVPGHDGPHADQNAAAGPDDTQTGTDTARCSSCEHGADIHDADGRCWFTVGRGVPGRDLVCPCQTRRLTVEEDETR